MLLRLQLIGRMQALTLANESVLPLGRKTRGLLAILALSGRRPVLRLRLAELLWSRRSEEQARASLRQEIHRLLEALTPLGVDVITVERHTLALKPALTSVDAERILNANANQADSLPPIDGVLLEELNGTDPALDSWLQNERDRLREHAIGLFEQMLLRQREPAGTLAAARQLLLLDTLHERAWRATIRAQLQAGDTGLALQTAERCNAAFAARHGAEPGPETRRLLSELGHSQSGSAAGDILRNVASAFPDDPVLGEEQNGSAPEPRGEAPAPAQGFGAARLPDRLEARQRDPHDSHPLLAVLPLLDLDGTGSGVAGSVGGGGGLAVGMVDAITAGLVRQGQLRLLSGSELQGSLSQGREDAVLRRSFGLDYVLDGTLQRAAGRLRVIVRLTDIRQHGQIVWAQRFDAVEAEFLPLQDQIATVVSARLPIEIMLVEGRRMRRRPLSELDPHGLVMRAISCILTGDQGQSEQALSLLGQSIDLDGEDPLAHVAAGLAHLLRVLQDWGDPDLETGLAEACTRAAVERAPLLAAAMALRCIVRSELGNMPEAALALAERARTLQPESPSAWAGSVFPLVRLGRLDEAAACFARYKALFPTHPLEMLLDLPGIMIPLLRGEDEEAARIGLTLSELRPGFAPPLGPYLSALGHLRRGGEAARVRAQLEAIRPGQGVSQLVEAAGLRRAADRERYAEGLRLAGVKDDASDGVGGTQAGVQTGVQAGVQAGAIDGAGPLGGARRAG